MARTDNYQLQAQQAKRYFLRYDQEALIRKLKLEADEKYLYVKLLCKQYRLRRATGEPEKAAPQGWEPADTHAEVMTLLDLLCDSREDRFLSGRWKQMSSFGLMFHQELLEDGSDPVIRRFQNDPEGLRRVCLTLGGEKMPTGDVSYAIDLFDGLRIWLQFWQGDEEFAPRIRYLWDENALMYLKYETMYFAVNLLRQTILEMM